MGFDPDSFIDRQWKKFEREAKQHERRNKVAWKRQKVGNVMKGQDGKPDYIKIEMDISLKKGVFLNLESQKAQLESLEANREKMSDEVFAKQQERIERIPSFVRFEIVKLTKE